MANATSHAAIARADMLRFEAEATRLRLEAAALIRQAKQHDRQARAAANRFLAFNGYCFTA